MNETIRTENKSLLPISGSSLYNKYGSLQQELDGFGSSKPAAKLYTETVKEDSSDHERSMIILKCVTVRPSCS